MMIVPIVFTLCTVLPALLLGWFINSSERQQQLEDDYKWMVKWLKEPSTREDDTAWLRTH